MTAPSGKAQWSRPWLFVTAFITGAVVMALEILGSRLLAPMFGNSLFVWGALIGVILAAMSSGYATGGWLADRRPAGAVVAGLLLASGGWPFLVGLAWWWRAAAVRARTAAPVVGGLGLMGWLALHPVLVLPAPIYQEDSPYQQIRVRDDDLLRYLILDRTFHAIMWRVEPVELFLPYSQMMMAALALHPAPKRALILGHGGGSLAKWLARRWPDLELDLVEVDPSVVRAAEQYFGYSGATGHRMYVNDARAFFRTTDARYDVIWLDVFARHLIPFHLTTQEF